MSSNSNVLSNPPPSSADYSSHRHELNSGRREWPCRSRLVPVRCPARDHAPVARAPQRARVSRHAPLVLALLGSAYATWFLWPTAWAILPYALYAILYATMSDSRWHESVHGTAFKTDWMNNALYEIASFMVMREATVWRWSHNRHHSDTIVVGRDPEIAVPRPPEP